MRRDVTARQTVSKTMGGTLIGPSLIVLLEPDPEFSGGEPGRLRRYRGVLVAAHQRRRLQPLGHEPNLRYQFQYEPHALDDSAACVQSAATAITDLQLREFDHGAHDVADTATAGR